MYGLIFVYTIKKGRPIRIGRNGHYLKKQVMFCHFIWDTEWFLVIETETNSGKFLENTQYPQVIVKALCKSRRTSMVASAE